jgi:hypothetical protein
MFIEIFFVSILTIAWLFLWHKHRTKYYIWYTYLNLLIIVSILCRYFLDARFENHSKIFLLGSLALIALNTVTIIVYLLIGIRHLSKR